MNDKCDAGTGRFFELVARLLNLEINELGQEGEDLAVEEIDLNSTCIVFAESEIVSLLARGVPKEAIIKALHRSVARRIVSLAGRDFVGQDVWLDGGSAVNKSLVFALEEELMNPVYVSEFPQFTVAFGAASSI
jgi:predicted CoA-substrate-specific enzyme activase